MRNAQSLFGASHITQSMTYIAYVMTPLTGVNKIGIDETIYFVCSNTLAFRHVAHRNNGKTGTGADANLDSRGCLRGFVLKHNA